MAAQHDLGTNPQARRSQIAHDIGIDERTLQRLNERILDHVQSQFRGRAGGNEAASARAGGTAISDSAWAELALSLGVEEAALRAVAAVESAGSGFLASGKPKILFEGHAFHRLTGGRFSARHPDISHRSWDRSKYKGGQGEWDRLERAIALDRAAALQAASWGMFQIMGFNYAYCGCADVETFVAGQCEGTERQLRLFARFISRRQYLDPLRNKDWAGFAKAYNGPGYEKNGYHTKMAKAHARELQRLQSRGRAGAFTDAAVEAAIAGPDAAVDEPPWGRESFAPVLEVRRRDAHRRDVRPDPADLRDWQYQPNIALVPKPSLLPHDPKPVKQQGRTNACTGFALATVIEYLLDRGERPVESISGYMLYEMARHYDEWAGDIEDTGSSLRGALKGWSKHGACCDRLWKEMQRPPAGAADGDWCLDAVGRPMGAYYRISPENIRDMHIALCEAGVLFASAFTHPGWDRLLKPTTVPPPRTVDDIVQIEEHKGSRDLGHAFAIVGYTRDGFIVQNSWGTEWGRGGFALLTYRDWLENAMDCWVVQLGVVTAEHDAVASAPSLRMVGGRVLLSRDPVLADHEISPFVINTENDGQLSRRGRFYTREQDLQRLIDHHLVHACRQWGCTDAVDVAIYAHGGLTTEDAAAVSARRWIPYLYSQRIFPIFLMWETGAFKTVCNIFEDAVRGEQAKTGGERWDRFRARFEEWRNERLEGLARLPGSRMWLQMKQNAEALTGTEGAVTRLFRYFSGSTSIASLPPKVRLHLIGHSAGAIVHTHLGARALQQNLDLASISLLAPAVRLQLFDEQLGAAIASRDIPVLIANLTDAAERNDGTCAPYGQSLLYLVSRSFEEAEETPLLGMERHLTAALPSHDWGAHVIQLRSPGQLWDDGLTASRATTHGGLDDDDSVREAVARFIKRATDSARFTGTLH